MKPGLFASLLLTTAIVNAQDYAVTLNNDTITGVAIIYTYDLVDRVEIVQGRQKIQFTATQVKSLKFQNEIYQTVRTDNGYRLMKLVKSGYLSLYLGRAPNSLRYEIEYLAKKDWTSIEVPSLQFKSVMTKFLKDCETLPARIRKGELGRKDLDKIISEYNLCIDNQTKAFNASIPVSASDPKLMALAELKSKLQRHPVPSQKDVLDLINDITVKVNNKQEIPNYLLDGLQDFLEDAPDYQTDLTNILKVLKGQ